MYKTRVYNQKMCHFLNIDSIVCLIFYDTSKHKSKLYLVYFVKSV